LLCLARKSLAPINAVKRVLSGAAMDYANGKPLGVKAKRLETVETERVEGQAVRGSG